MKDIIINKADLDLYVEANSEVKVLKKTDTQYQLSVGRGILTIYLKMNGKVSFLSQGQEPEDATAFAQEIIEALAA